MKTTLTIEESAQLIELGVNTKLASMKEFVPIHPEVLKGNAEYAKPWGWFPKFRLEDILSILPKEIDDNPNTCLDMAVGKDSCGVCYINSNNGDEISTRFYAPELIDVLNQLLIWTIEQGHLKTEKK